MHFLMFPTFFSVFSTFYFLQNELKYLHKEKKKGINQIVEMKNKMNFSPSNNCGEHVDSLNVGP